MGLDLDDEELRCECGVSGIKADHDITPLFRDIHDQLPHRGHDAAGIAVRQEGRIIQKSGKGIASQVFDDELIARMEATEGVGHNRYKITGEGLTPVVAEGRHGRVAVSHNGNLTNVEEMKEHIRSLHVPVPENATDTLLIALWTVNGPGRSIEENMELLRDDYAEGAFSLAVLVEETGDVLGLRDKHGVRPLNYGKIKGGRTLMSETVPLRVISGHRGREIKPGELVRLKVDGLETISHHPDKRRALCAFEYIYFSRSESSLDGKYVESVRREIGRELAREAIARGGLPSVDIIAGVPYTSIPMAKGLAREAGLYELFDDVVSKNQYSVRTFINPDAGPNSGLDELSLHELAERQKMIEKFRREAVERKFNPLVPILQENPRVLLIDDSIVRLNTMPQVIAMLRDAGATEVHVLIGCPPIIDTCHMGVNIPERAGLAAANVSVEQIRRKIGANSLEYLSPQGLLNALGLEFDDVCMGCMTSRYPFEIKDKRDPYVVADTLEPSAADRHYN